MTPNKSDSVCDCIYGDGACKEHSDSGEELYRIIHLVWQNGYNAALPKEEIDIDPVYNNGNTSIPITKGGYAISLSPEEALKLVTAHIQAVGEENHSPEKDRLWNSREISDLYDELWDGHFKVTMDGVSQSIDRDTFIEAIPAYMRTIGEERVRESPDLPSLLRSYRKSLGLRQVDFAKRYGMSSPTAVSFWESGQRSMPNEVFADLLQYDRQRLAQYLGDKQE